MFYESPDRIQECLEDCQEAFGPDRAASIMRELTKQYETVWILLFSLPSLTLVTPRCLLALCETYALKSSQRESSQWSLTALLSQKRVNGPKGLDKAVQRC